MEKKITDDIISSLPDHMLHHIMSLLPPRYAASTSVLSRRWENLWLSFPSIDLDQKNFKSRQKLCLCLRAALARHNLSALQNLRLRMKLPGSPRLYQHVCEFMNIVLQESKILKDLEIEFLDYSFFRKHENVPLGKICVLPNETFSVSLYLIILRVEGCRFEGCPLVNLPKLKTLVMKNVFISEEFLLELVCGCPVIDLLSIKYCFGIKNVRICHPTLKKLVLGLRINLESLELKVPCVTCIKFDALVDSLAGEGLIEVLGYKNSKKILARNLETLCLECFKIEPEVLHNIISSFPNLEKLGINCCDILGRVQLYSNRLTSLEMTDCMLLEEVDIRAPNLQNLEYLHNLDGALVDYMAFRYLRRIFLESIEVTCGVIWINNSNCPVLVSLELVFCINMRQLRIAANKLESLEVSECEELEYCMIVAPQLLTFSYTGQVVNMSNLVASRNLCVKLHLKQPEGDHEHVGVGFVQMFMGFLERVSVAAASTSIELGYDCAKCLVLIKDAHVPPISFVQRLKVETWTNVMGLRDILSCSLGISTYCNVLSINMWWFSLTLQFQAIEKKEACVPTTNLARIEDHLVRVEMKGFIGSDEQMDLVQYLVGKARHMQHMTIWMKKGEEYDATQKCLEACHGVLRLSSLFQLFDIVSHGSYVSFSRNEI